MGLTCSNCGNERNFLVKTLQIHVIQASGEDLELTEQGRPAVLELLCDECEADLDLSTLESGLRRGVVLLVDAH